MTIHYLASDDSVACGAEDGYTSWETDEVTCDDCKTGIR